MAVDTVQCELLSVFKFPLTGKNTGNFSTEIALPIKLASVHACFSEFFIQLQESETGNSWRRNREICFSNSARGSEDVGARWGRCGHVDPPDFPAAQIG